MAYIEKFLFIVLLFIFSTTLYSYSSQTDSLLLQQIEQAQGEKKLELMFEYANNNIIYTDSIFDIIDRIENEALLQKNMRYVAGSYMLKSRYFMNQNNLDSTVYYGNLSNKTYNDNNIVNPGYTYQFMAIVYMNSGYYELAIHYLNLYIKTYKEDVQAYMMLGMTYMNSEKYDLSEKYFLDALNLVRVDSSDRVMDEVTIYLCLADLSYRIADYEKTIDYCSKCEILLDNYVIDKGNSSNAEIRYSLTYTMSATAYFTLGDVEKGRKALEKAAAVSYSQSNEIAKMDIRIAWFEYYFLVKDYDKASKCLDEILSYVKENFKYSINYHVILKRKIKLLEAQGKYKDALLAQKELTNNKDSIYQKNIPLQISELSKSYELDKARIEKEKNKLELGRSRAIIIGLVVVSILLCAIIYIIRRNAKRFKEKNRALYKHYAEVDAFIELTKKSVSSADEKASLEKENSLFSRFKLYLEEKELFKNSELDREKIALALGTNRQYLADAVKAETGKTFMDYINDYRLDYARHQLILDNTTPVTNIIQESGFSSNTTFYRLFKEKYGMTPNELRKAKTDLEKEILNVEITKMD